ncbi:MAG: phenylalanine--tRNA ligase subunit beta [Proteobacteria bacterium]|nr:phenylalanine--tRNA ligase subunit beta [Pseudomonadota bacterium]
MKFTTEWLSQYIDSGLTAAALSHRLTMAGLEVDSVCELFRDLGDTVKVAKILSAEKHPDADKLTVCTIQVGAENRRVVCGAPNARAGMLTAIALPGAVLQNGLIIKKSKIRGEISEGMLCSEKDLGVSEDHSGIMEIPGDFESGVSLVDVLGLADTAIEVDLTPNRPDCASVIGIAREVGGFVNKKINHPVQGPLPELTGENIPFSVDVLDQEACPRYAARMLKGVTIGPSPWWLKKRLLAVGQRPINNIVDVTNFVMLELGQPLHAFDFDMLHGGKIIVRNAKPDEKIISLDGTERQLDSEMLMICDAEKPVAIAGVMGGKGSQVTDDTINILLESAYFSPISIRRTVRSLNMGTDSSYRFERGVDPEGIPVALERAIRLMQEIAGGEIVVNGVDCCGAIPAQPKLSLRVQRVCDMLGMEISADVISELLQSIEFDVVKTNGKVLTIEPPSFRVDIEREIDLIEEVARLVGYNNIPISLPVSPMSFPETGTGRRLRKKVADIMTALGFYEAINYSFVSENHFDMLGLDKNDSGRDCVRLMNPLAEDQSVMRRSLVPGLLENVKRNINHQNVDVQLFELGKVFIPTKDPQPLEEQRLTAMISGRRNQGFPLLYAGTEKADLYDLKGVIQSLLHALRLDTVSFAADEQKLPYAKDGNCLYLKAAKVIIGCFGYIAKDVLKEFGIKQDVLFMDLSLTRISELKARSKAFEPLPRFPAVKWDIAVVVPEAVGGGELLQTISDFDNPLVEKAEIFDIFRGKSVEHGYKSVAVSITYRSREQTLEDDMVAAVHKNITNLLVSRFQGKLREV